MNYLFLILLGGCALFKMDALVPQRIRENQLAGRWSNQYGKFAIWCEGQFEYYEPMKWDNMGAKNSEKGGYIKKFHSQYQFKTGPFLGETHEINRMPYKNDKGHVAMDMDGKTWYQDEKFDCGQIP